MASCMMTVLAFLVISLPLGGAVKGFYQGCYKDDNHRLLEKLVSRNKQMSQGYCFGLCRDYKYAGLEANHECYCGNDLDEDKYPMVSDGECDAHCWGKLSQKCGGYWRISIFT